jgi:hypothetical protein
MSKTDKKKGREKKTCALKALAQSGRQRAKNIAKKKSSSLAASVCKATRTHSAIKGSIKAPLRLY